MLHDCLFELQATDPTVVIEENNFPTASKLIFTYNEGSQAVSQAKVEGDPVEAAFFFKNELAGKAMTILEC